MDVSRFDYRITQDNTIILLEINSVSIRKQRIVLLPINIKHHMNHLSIFILNASCDVYINHENKLKAMIIRSLEQYCVYRFSDFFKTDNQVNI
ncbi:hypothetical protein DMI77_08820 [Akkermansia muciniphila]|nr:hypothetical protein DMI77_08820 [Akkermansia muciniphila]